MGLPKDILDGWVLNNIKKFDHKLVGDPANGTRRVSGQLLSPPDTVMASSTTSSSGTELPSVQPDLEVPLNLYSVQAFEFIGFTTKKSEQLLKIWASADEFSLQEVLAAHIDEFCCGPVKDPRTTMQELGISEARQERIMDPHFNDVRNTAPIYHWIMELVLENLWTLENLSERLNRNLLVLQSGQKSSSSLRGGASEYRSKYDLIQAGHTTLYRSTSARRLENVFGKTSVRLEKMCWMPMAPNDFSFEKVAYYWSNEHWVSERFAAYTSNIIQAPGNVYIIRALVPQGLLEGEGVWKLNFGDDWKKLVWHSRNSEPYPPNIQEKHDQSKIIIGPVSINETWAFRKMKSWKEVTESNTWIVRSESRNYHAMQYVWIGMRAMAAMNEPLKDKWDIFRGNWLLCRQNAWADCRARHIPEPEKWVSDHLA
ncbi:hypothetical protein ACET3X_006816 [Alternaria dauci]|uniref:Uncharacterized protein n=1 Tax=Alternaria dauci TaxID=48095 RepID=A0ABR3UET1_9PLEO